MTPQNAKQYGEDLKVNFEMIPDHYCGNVYPRFFPMMESCQVPGAVIVRDDWSVVQTFPPGAPHPVDSIMARLKLELGSVNHQQNLKRTYVCSARSIIGRYFYATAETEALAQAMALSKCQEHSLVTCYKTGCDIGNE